MYGAIGEEDVLAGLWKRRCRTENTRAGEMLMQVPCGCHDARLLLVDCGRLPVQLSATKHADAAPLTSFVACSTHDTHCTRQVGLLPAAQDVFLDACRKPLAPDTRECSMPSSLPLLQCDVVISVSVRQEVSSATWWGPLSPLAH
jgi:hypothetical protein